MSTQKQNHSVLNKLLHFHSYSGTVVDFRNAMQDAPISSPKQISCLPSTDQECTTMDGYRVLLKCLDDFPSEPTDKVEILIHRVVRVLCE